jgi:hypothetical protein
MSPEVQAVVLFLILTAIIYASLRALRSHAIRRALRSDDPDKRAHAKALARHFHMKEGNDGR